VDQKKIKKFLTGHLGHGIIQHNRTGNLNNGETKMKKLTTTNKIITANTPAAKAAERATRIYRLMNSGISQRVATMVIDRDYENMRKYS